MNEVVACTVITRNYMAFARTLAQSLAQHHSALRLYVLFADDIGDLDLTGEPYTVVRLSDLNDFPPEMCFHYTAFELCNALKAHLHEYMFDRTNEECWLYLDSDILVLNPLVDIVGQLKDHSILLSPACYRPVDVQRAVEVERRLLRFGVFNGGILGITRCEEARQFIAWLKQRLRYFALDYPEKGMFTDQLWLNLVPLLFRDVGFIAHPGVNVGHWNLHERELGYRSSGSYTSNDSPLLCFHFSNWSIENPRTLRRLPPGLSENSAVVLCQLGEQYRDLLLANGHRVAKEYLYAFGRFRTGQPISKRMRRVYWDDLLQGRPVESPFSSYAYFRRAVMIDRIRRFRKWSRSFLRFLG